jgi:hypothetical protein
MAHIEIIDEYSNGIDLFEKNRAILSSYIIEEEITGTLGSTKEKGLDYQIFELSNNCWKVLMEYAKTNSIPDGIPVKPITYDGFNVMSVNPFKRPDGLKAWRLDLNSDLDEKRDVKILFKKANQSDYINKYKIVYLVVPKSFDLEADEIPNSLDNNPFLCEKIVNRAVELSTRDYKSNDLQSQVQINKRSE